MSDSVNANTPAARPTPPALWRRFIAALFRPEAGQEHEESVFDTRERQSPLSSRKRGKPEREVRSEG